MENTLLAGVCPICYVYVMVVPGVRESEVVSCGDCEAPLIVERVASRTVSLTKAPQAILL